MFQLRVLYCLVMEWRRSEALRENRNIDLLGGADSWLNGLDLFNNVVSFYLRRIIKEGKKDSSKTEDSNHLAGRLDRHIGELVTLVREVLRKYKNAGEGRKQELSETIARLLVEKGIKPSDAEFSISERNRRIIQDFVQDLVDTG